MNKDIYEPEDEDVEETDGPTHDPLDDPLYDPHDEVEDAGILEDDVEHEEHEEDWIPTVARQVFRPWRAADEPVPVATVDAESLLQHTPEDDDPHGIWDSDHYPPRDRIEYRTGGTFQDVDGSEVSFGELALPGDAVEHDVERMIAVDLLFAAHGEPAFHVVERTGGRPGRPRKNDDPEALRERADVVAMEEGFSGGIYEATSTTGNGKKTPEPFLRVLGRLAAEGWSYALIHEVLGPSKNTSTRAHQIVARLPEVP